jgi:GTP cyclohydrolase II
MRSPSDCLLPTLPERLARVMADLRMGLPCLLTHGADSAVVVVVETVTLDRFAALEGRFGRPELVLTAHRAQALMTSPVADGPVRILPPAHAALDWFQRLADPAMDAKSGPVGPLHVLRDGANLIHTVATQLAKRAEVSPAVAVFAAPDGYDDLQLMPLQASDALAALADVPVLTPVMAAGFPLEVHDQGRLHVFRDPSGAKEHYALEIGTPDRALPVLSRLHSACFTGDVLGSLKCDCGPQLRAALARMGDEGAGVLLYLNQEGRGIGLANKMRVYDLQAQGFDTVEANNRLGYADDERDFRVAAVMLRTLGFDKVRLLTNNPAKVKSFADSGIAITEQIPLRVGRNTHNQHYLAVKALKSGHQL